MINKVDELKVKIFADGANKEDMLRLYNQDFIKGLKNIIMFLPSLLGDC